MAFVLTPWLTAPAQPSLTDGAVHLWRFPLDGEAFLESLLDEEELQRARRLRSPEKARAFIAARARLRQILARYQGRPPQGLGFVYGAAGKPALADTAAGALSFNLAHSGHWGLCAVTAGCPVGVDIERIDPALAYEKLAARFFSAIENSSLQACPSQRRRRQFFRIWTRKEAWLKGRGGGFSDPDQDLGAAHLAGCCTHAGGWWLRSFPVGRHYLAALAVPRQSRLVRRWNAWPVSGSD